MKFTHWPRTRVIHKKAMVRDEGRRELGRRCGGCIQALSMWTMVKAVLLPGLLLVCGGYCVSPVLSTEVSPHDGPIDKGSSITTSHSDEGGPEFPEVRPESVSSHNIPRVRVKRQIMSFFLRMMGREGIRDYVKNTKTENFPQLMDTVVPDDIVFIVSNLPPDEIMRVVTAMPTEKLIDLTMQMSPDQLMEMLSYIPPEGMITITESLSQEQMEKFVLKVPPEGIVNLTRMMPPDQAKKLMKSVSPDVILNMTQSMPDDVLLDLMTSLPPELLLDMIQTLSPDDLERLMNSMPPQVMMAMTSAMSPQLLEQMISRLPPGFLESFVSKISPEKMGQMVAAITAEQMIKLMTAMPAERAPNISTLLRPDLMGVVIDSMPDGLINNLTRLLPPERLTEIVAAVPQDVMLSMATSLTAQQMAGVMKTIDPQALTVLMKAMPTERMVSIATSLPVETIVNITVIMARDRDVMSGILGAVMDQDLIVGMAGSFPQELAFEILDRLPEETIGQLAAAFPVDKAFVLLSSLKSAHLDVNVTQLLFDVPKPLLSKMITSVSPEVIANMSAQLSRSQLRQIVQLISPEMIRLVMTSAPPEVFFGMALSLPESVMAKFLNAMNPKVFGNLMKAMPVDVIKSMMEDTFSNQRLDLTPQLVSVAIQKMANILNSVPAKKLTRLMKAIPQDLVVQMIDLIPPQIIAKGAVAIEGQEALPSLMSAVPVAVMVHFMSITPPESIIKVMDAVPTDTLRKLAAMSTDIPQDKIREFFGLVKIGMMKKLVIKLPPRTIEKMMSSVPPDTVTKMAYLITPTAVVPFLESMKPRQLERLMRSMKPATLGQLVQAIPVDVMVNLTESLPAELMEKVMTAIPPETMGVVVNSLDPEAVVPIMKAVPVSVMEDMMNSLPTDVLVNMTRTLPPKQMQEMIDLLPDSLIGKMVSILPPEVMADMVKVFEPETMLSMMQKLDSDQLVGIMADMPHQVILDITKAQTPEQTMRLLQSLPSEGLANLTNALPTDIMMEMMQAIPPEGMIGIAGSMPLNTLFSMASRLSPQEMTLMMERFVEDEDLIPNLLTSFDPDRLVSMTEAIPLDLIMKMMSRVDASIFKDLAQRLMPKGRQMIEDLLDTVVRSLGANSTETFQSCLADVGEVVHSMLNSSDQWPFHFLDASGRPGPGMLEGNIHMRGNFDQCKRIRHVLRKASLEERVIAGSYCHVQFVIPVEHLPPIPGDGMLPMPEIAMDLCVPDTCKDFDIFGLLKTVQLPKNMTIPRVSCQKDLDITHDPTALLACGCLVAIVVVVLIGTVVDCVVHRRTDRKYVTNDNNNYNNGKYSLPAGVGVCGGSTETAQLNCNDHYKKGGMETGSQSADKLHKSVTKDKLIHNAQVEIQAGGEIVEMERLMKKKEEEVVGVNGDCASAHADHTTDVQHAASPTNCVGAYVPGSVTGDGIADVIKDSMVGCQPLCDVRYVKKTQKSRGFFNSRFIGTFMHQDTIEEVAAVEPLWVRLITAFSLAASLKRVLSVSRAGHETVTCLHGMRVLSILWVMLANTVLFSALYFENLMNAADQLISLPAQVIINSSLAQDTFFTISGVVTALTFFRCVSGSGKVSLRHLLYFYLHRYVRLWPAYLLVLMTCVCLLGYAADGPHWPPALQDQCRQQWWSNFFFINNYFFPLQDMCMSWTWFLANLMQFHWIAPLILVPFAFGLKVVGFLMVGSLIVAHVVTTIILEIHINGDFLRRQTDYFWGIYQQPYCRVAPYAMGLALGFVLTRLKFKFRMNKVVALTGWLLALAASSLVMFVTYDENRHLLVDATGWSLPARTTYQTVQHPLWGLIVCWVVFACSTGNGGAVNKVLSWRGYLPLSRLTYCAYLIHPIIVICDLIAYRVFAYFTMAYVIFRYLGYLMVTYILALLLSVISESPALAVEKVVLSSIRRA